MNSKQILKKKVSVFSAPIKNTSKKKDKELHEVYQLIKSNYYEYQTSRLRLLNIKKENSDYKQSKFDYATWSGTFSKREDAGITQHSGLIIIDLDHIPKTIFDDIKNRLCSDGVNLQYMVMCFTSPNGDGLKLLYLIEHKTHTQEENFRGLCNFLYKELEIAAEYFDESGKDISRACFIPHDPEVFLNPMLLGSMDGEMTTFNPIPYLPEKQQLHINDNKISPSQYDEIIEKILTRAKELKKEFISQKRNQFILYVASQLNSYGVPLKIAFSELDQRYGLSKYEDHSKTLNYVYDKQKSDFGKFKNITEKNPKKEENPPYETPCIDGTIMDVSPKIFKNIVDCFPIKREKDVAYFSFLAMASGALPNVRCIHRNEDFLPNIIGVISAGFAGGKGVAAKIREIGLPLHKYLKEKSKELKEQYEDDLLEYKEKKKNGEITDEKPPEEPFYPIFFIPADSSAASFKEKLAKCGGQAVMFDSEADTLTSVLSQEWGGSGYSSLLRKTAMNETIDYSRKSGDDEINKPALGVVITGTPGAIARLIPNSEDGLFSRIAFYSYEPKLEFDPKTFDHSQWKKKEELFNKIGDDFMKMYQQLDEFGSRGNRLVFYWDNKHQDILYDAFTKWLKQHKAIVGANFSRLLFRLALMTTRISTILTVLRLFEKGQEMTAKDLGGMSVRDKDIRITCTEEDFYNTLHIVDIIRQHTFSVYENLPNESKQEPIKTMKSVILKFYTLLPNKFKREQALEEAAPLAKIKERTMDKYLGQLVKSKLLERLEGNEGWYLKTDMKKK